MYQHCSRRRLIASSLALSAGSALAHGCGSLRIDRTAPPLEQRTEASLPRQVSGGTSSPAAIPLPPIAEPGGPPVEQVIQRRRSIRDYSDSALSLDDLARLLHFGDGITDPQRGLRAAPSAGALFPVEIYAIVFRVEALAPGIYRYLPVPHALEPLRTDDVRAALVYAALGQSAVREAASVLVETGIVGRLQPRYGDRSLRYLLIEAGHVAQNVYLEATALGLGCCVLGAFLDDGVGSLLGIDGEAERPVLLLTLGCRAQS